MTRVSRTKKKTDELGRGLARRKPNAPVHQKARSFNCHEKPKGTNSRNGQEGKENILTGERRVINDWAGRSILMRVGRGGRARGCFGRKRGSLKRIGMAAIGVGSELVVVCNAAGS